jgi:hypothetical protein
LSMADGGPDNRTRILLRQATYRRLPQGRGKAGGVLQIIHLIRVRMKKAKAGVSQATRARGSPLRGQEWQGCLSGLEYRVTAPRSRPVRPARFRSRQADCVVRAIPAQWVNGRRARRPLAAVNIVNSFAVKYRPRSGGEAILPAGSHDAGNEP